MKKALLGTALLAVIFLPCWVWLGGTVVHAAGGDPQKGQAVYARNCVLCHGVQGRGDGPVGKTIDPPAADFTSAVSKRKTEAELLTTIEHGRPPTAMIGWKGQLSDAEIQDVLAYVKSLRQ